MNNQTMISGTVLDPHRQPVSDAQIYFIEGPVPLPDVALLTDSKGRFTLGAPAPGMYTLGCHADGFVSTSIAVNVKRGQENQVTIQLKKQS